MANKEKNARRTETRVTTRKCRIPKLKEKREKDEKTKISEIGILKEKRVGLRGENEGRQWRQGS